MAEDSGLWYIDGKVRNGAYRLRVWAIFKKLTDRFYEKRERMEARHRKEKATMDCEFNALQKRRPFTPWVGRADTGAVATFVESAKRDVAFRKSI